VAATFDCVRFPLLADGMYCTFSPYEDPADDLLASMAQLSIFFSLVASIVTNAYPDE
jgi:hypothetical protein